MNKTPLTLESVKYLKKGDTLIVRNVRDLNYDTKLKMDSKVEFIRYAGGDLIQIQLNDKTIQPIGFFYWRFAAPSREKLTWEVAQLLPKGTMLEAAEPSCLEFKTGDRLKTIGCVSALGYNYVKVITPNNPYGGGFCPDQFYMPEIKEGTELYHKIKITEHQNALDLLNTENRREKEYQSKFQAMVSRHTAEILDLKKEYGIA